MLDLDYLSRYLLIQLCWTFIPKTVTSFVIYLYHFLMYKSRPEQRPQKGSEEYARDFKKIHALVFVAYLLYSLTAEVYKQKPSYYKDLKISRRQCETGLKSRYRAILHELHPDKTTDSNPELFLKLKTRYEILNNRATRNAYDTFGPKIIQLASKARSESDNGADSTFWRSCMNIARFELLGYYGGALLTLLLACFVNGNFATIFWRAVLVLGFFFVEASFYVVEKSFTRTCIDIFLGVLPAYQQINILRCLALNSPMLVEQVAKVYRAGEVISGEDQLTLTEKFLRAIYAETHQLSGKFLPANPAPEDKEE